MRTQVEAVVSTPSGNRRGEASRQTVAASQLIRILGTQRSVTIIARPYAAVAAEIRESARSTPRGTRDTAVEVFRVAGKSVTLSVESSFATRPSVTELEKASAITLNFNIRYRLAGEMADGLRQIFLGKPGLDAKPSAVGAHEN